MEQCLITGASRGIGAALARRLATPERTLWLNHRRSPALARALAEELRARGAGAHEIEADVADADAVLRMAERVRAEGNGALDVLVHNAGAPLAPMPIHKLDWERDVAAPLGVSCRGFLNLVHAFGPMLAANARVVVILSEALFDRAPARMGAHLAAKGALFGLARAAATELGRRGATVNFVSPGLTDTDLVSVYGARALELIAQDLPLGRLADADEVATVIARLLESTDRVHGVNVFVNAGAGS